MVHLDAHPDLSASTTMAAQLIMEEPHQVASWLSPLLIALPTEGVSER